MDKVVILILYGSCRKKFVKNCMGYLKHVSIFPFNKTVLLISPNNIQDVVCKKRFLTAWSDRSIEITFHLTNYKVMCNESKVWGLQGRDKLTMLKGKRKK